jgi:ferredoxin
MIQYLGKEDKKVKRNFRHCFWGAKSTRFTGWRRSEAAKGETDPSGLSADEELRFLRCYAETISQRLNIIKKIIGDKKVIDSQSPNVVAIVDEEECSGCGICFVMRCVQSAPFQLIGLLKLMKANAQPA